MNLNILKDSLVLKITNKNLKLHSIYLKIIKKENILKDILLFSDFLCNDDLKQKFYHWLYKIDHKKECKICNTEIKFQGFKHPYNLTCSKNCNKIYRSSIEFKNKVKNTNLIKYGVENPWQSKEVKEKIKQTNLNRYGVENPNQSKKIKEKIKQTNLDRYGVENPWQSEEVKEKIKQTNLDKYGVEYAFQSEEVKEKIKQTNLIKYGVKYNLQSKEIREKIKQTNLDRYGVENPWQSEEVKEKIKQTNLDKYGVECPNQSKEIREKTKTTNLNKYGFEYPLQIKQFKEKSKQTCLNKYGSTNYKNSSFFKEKTKNERLNDFLSKISNYKFINIDQYENITLKCNKCNKEFKESIYFLRERYNYKREICTICNPFGKVGYISNKEKEFGKFINSIYKDTILYNDRRILDGFELDVYVPEKQLAFEFNGIYWHSNGHKPEKYHQDKKLNALKKNVNLIHIWEDDWEFKKDIVKSRILNVFGLNKKIYARKCIIKNVDMKSAKIFLNQNHIQGFVVSKNYIGLYFNNELIAIMSFGLRYNRLELLRYCTKININIIGGFSKLLKYYLKNNVCSEVYSYGDLDWLNPNSNVYLKNGFEIVKYLNPGYFWSNGEFRESRLKYQKHKLINKGYDKNKTEDDIMFEKGYLKIYNSGNVLFKINIK